MKKGQVQMQVFIYVIAVIVAALILLFGYRAVRTFVGQGEQLALVNLEEGLEEQVQIMSQSFERVSTRTFDIPSQFVEICLLDLSKNADLYPVCDERTNTFNPVVCTSWIDTAVEENVFLVDNDGITSKLGQGFLGQVQMENPGCYPVVNGEVTLRFRGIGGKAEVEVLE